MLRRTRTGNPCAAAGSLRQAEASLALEAKTIKIGSDTLESLNKTEAELTMGTLYKTGKFYPVLNGDEDTADVPRADYMVQLIKNKWLILLKMRI